jgi:hypothetical protein
VQIVRVSPKAKWVAATSQNWQVGVWNRETGQIAYVWDVPVGRTAENAALAFDEKEESIYFASGEHACCLNLKTGERTGYWKLPPGLNDNLAVRPGRKPMLLRREPDGPKPWKSWSYRSRELLDGGKLGERFSRVADETDIYNIYLNATGTYFAVPFRDKSTTTRLHLYDGDTGKPIPLPTKSLRQESGAIVTHNEKLLFMFGIDEDGAVIRSYRMPEMTLQSTQRGDGYASMDDDGTIGTRLVQNGFRDGLSLFHIGEKRPVLTFDVGHLPSSVGIRQLTSDGRYCAWGRSDGTVCVADVNRCVEQLTDFPIR